MKSSCRLLLPECIARFIRQNLMLESHKISWNTLCLIARHFVIDQTNRKLLCNRCGSTIYYGGPATLISLFKVYFPRISGRRFFHGVKYWLRNILIILSYRSRELILIWWNWSGQVRVFNVHIWSTPVKGTGIVPLSGTGNKRRRE